VRPPAQKLPKRNTTHKPRGRSCALREKKGPFLEGREKLTNLLAFQKGKGKGKQGRPAVESPHRLAKVSAKEHQPKT